jgi:septin 3/9/12
VSGKLALQRPRPGTLLTVHSYIQDTRIHCCLYFINPSGHGLRPIDIVVLKKLSETVNVVPVIAKADSLTLEERQLFKDRIKEEFAFHNIRMYPYDNEEYDSEEAAMNSQIKVGSYKVRNASIKRR